MLICPQVGPHRVNLLAHKNKAQELKKTQAGLLWIDIIQRNSFVRDLTEEFSTATVVPDVQEEVKDYQEQLKQMLKDLAKEKEKDAEKPLPLMNQVLRSCCATVALHSPVR